MPTPRPDSAPAPDGDADRTVRLAPAPDGDADRTVRLAPAPDGDADRTVRLAPAAVGGAETVRLGSGPVAEEETVRLAGSAAPEPAAGPDAEATVRLDADEAVSATFLDPRVWGAARDTGETTTLVETPAHGTPTPVVPVPVPLPAPTGAEPAAPAAPETSSAAAAAAAAAASDAEQPLAPGELRRFGPGVPPLAADVWHGRTAPDAEQPRRRRVGRWLVPVAVLLAVLALLFWRFATPALAVTGVTVTTDPAGPGCAGTAVITAAVETDGRAGTLRYRWLRSDGTTSGELHQDVRSGAHRTDLVLRWSFEGQGSLAATATLEIVEPGSRSAAVSFPYRCA